MYHLKFLNSPFPQKSTIVLEYVEEEIGILLIFQGKEQEGA